MMLGSEDNILHSRILGGIGPLYRVEGIRIEDLVKVPIPLLIALVGGAGGAGDPVLVADGP